MENQLNDLPEETLPSQASEQDERDQQPKENSDSEKEKEVTLYSEEYTSLEVKEVPIEQIDVSLPAGKQAAMIRRRAQLPEDIENSRSLEEALYTDTMTLGLQTRMNNDIFHDALAPETTDEWKQVVKSEEGVIGATRPKFKDTDIKLTGEKAVLRLRSLLNRGGQITIPLWHSGFFATFNAPTEEEILAFHDTITNERIQLGRKIYGAALANESVYVNKAVLDFAMDHLVDTNLVDGREGFMRELSALDIQHVAWGLACVIYQNGFNFARAIITDDPNEHKVQTGKINVTKLQRTRRDLLTEKQIRHMSRRNQRVSPEALKAYHDEFTRGVPREIQLTENVKVTLEVPKAITHIDAGYSWVDGIVEMIDESFHVNGIDERNRKITTLSKATQLRQYDHWVKKISVYNQNYDKWEDFERDEEYTVEMMLGDLSSDDELRKKFFDEVRNYMNDSTISLIAVPTASEQEDKVAPNRFPSLFPIDCVSVFILLLSRRRQSVEIRSSL